MTSPIAPNSMCAICRQLTGVVGEADTNGNRGGDFKYTCDAYPDGIPRKISDGKFDHREPFEGDRGIRFTPHDDDDTRRVNKAWGT